MKDSVNLITWIIWNPQKSISFQHHNKKRIIIIANYYEKWSIAIKSLKKPHKPYQRLLKKKNMEVENKIEPHEIKTQFTSAEDWIPAKDIESRFMKEIKGNYIVTYNTICSRLRHKINLRNKDSGKKTYQNKKTLQQLWSR